MDRDIRECEAYGPDFLIGPTQRIMALEQRLPMDLLRDLEDRMPKSYEERRALVQNRVELDHRRRLNSHSGIATLERPGGMFALGISAP